MRKLLFVLVPVVILVVWLAARGTPLPEVPYVHTARETLVSTLTTNGKVEPLEWVSVHAQARGPVARIGVTRGQPVRAGQILATISLPEAAAEFSSAQSRVHQAQAELDILEKGGRAIELAEIESGLARAQAELETGKREAGALERLTGKKAATQAELDAARETVRRAELQIQSLERRRSSLVTPSDRQSAQARLQEAASGTEAAGKRLSAAQVQSPMSGIVYALEVKPGSFVQPGDPVARVGKLDLLRVTLYVDEPELGRVEKGMPVNITWDALPGRTWTGKVESVPLQVVPIGTRQVGEVICVIENPGLTLIPGTNINAEIRSRVVQNALTVPKEALRREGTETGVLKLENNKVIWRPVRLGASSITRVQITSGLSDGDQVVLPIDAPLKSGDQVRPVARS